MGEKEIYKALFLEFLADVDQKYPQLVIFSQDQDFANLAELAHYIKGAALNLAADPLGAYARELEMKARAADMDDMEALIESIGGEILRIKAFLAEICHKSGISANGYRFIFPATMLLQ